MNKVQPSKQMIVKQIEKRMGHFDSKGAMTKILNQFTKDIFVTGLENQEQLDNLKKKTIENLNKMIEYKSIKEIKEQAEAQLNEFAVEIEKLLRALESKIYELSLNLNQIEDQNSDLKIENQALLLKSSEFEKRIDQLLKENTELEQKQYVFEDMEKIFDNFHQKYPGFTLEKLMQKYEQLEGKSVEWAGTINNLELDKIQNEKSKKQLEQKADDKLYEMNKYIEQKEKEINKYKDIIAEEKEVDIDIIYYKQQYFDLSNKILIMYNDWKEQLSVYHHQDYQQCDKLELGKPQDMIEVMQKMTKITTSLSLQAYLRKIIVSTNSILRKFFPLHINEKFCPDKIYDLVSKLILQLKTENTSLKKDIQKSKAKQVQQ